MAGRPAHPDRVRCRGTCRARSTSASTGQLATYLGWLIPWGTPVTLLGDSQEQVAEAQRELVRIGIDRPAAAATGTPQEWTDEPLDRFERATFPTWPRSATTAPWPSWTCAAPPSTTSRTSRAR